LAPSTVPNQLAPDGPSEAKGEHRQGDLDDQGVSQAHRAADRGLEVGQHLGRDDAGVHELLDHAPDPVVHHDLGQEQDRHSDEKADVDREIVEERHRHPAERVALPEAQPQQGQPGDRRDADHPPRQELQCRSGQEHTPPELIERAPEHEREIAEVRNARAHRRPLR
jgi:hypothetical protein